MNAGRGGAPLFSRSFACLQDTTMLRFLPLHHIAVLLGAALLPGPDAAAVPASPQRAAQMVALRWTVPEPRLSGGRIERPLLHRELPLTLSAAQVEAVRQSGTLAGVRTAVDRLYAQVEARTPRDVRFTRVGTRWLGEARTGWTVNRAASDAALLGALRGGGRTSPLTVSLRAPARSVRWAAAQQVDVLASACAR
jgi:hypothetical protein